MTKNQFIKDVLPFSDKIYRLSFRLLNDREMAKDIVQTIFCKLWESRDKMDSIGNKEAFIITVTRNACLDKIRLFKDNTEIKYFHKVTEPQYEVNEYVEMIKTVIVTIPEIQRKVIELRDIEGFSFGEISAMLDLPLNNIRVSLSVARKKVRESIHKIYSYGL